MRLYESLHKTSLPVIWSKYNDPDIDLTDDILLDYHFKLCRNSDKKSIEKMMDELKVFSSNHKELDPWLVSWFLDFYKNLL